VTVAAAGAFFAASDIGGTFTDTVVADTMGTLSRYKASTTPEDLVQGVLETFKLAAEDRGLSVADFVRDVQLFAYGTPVATNALIERDGARTGVIHTAGFGDTLFIMRGYKGFGLDEEALKNFRTLVKTPSVVSRDLVRDVPERVDYKGRVAVSDHLGRGVRSPCHGRRAPGDDPVPRSDQRPIAVGRLSAEGGRRGRRLPTDRLGARWAREEFWRQRGPRYTEPVTATDRLPTRRIDPPIY
jgi:Hydantoinase/oxoprolinase N-terminal region